MSPPEIRDGEQLLDSWKEIASHLGRAVRTVQRWEKEEGLPVHRHQHAKAGTVFAYASELDAWHESREELPAEPARRLALWLGLAAGTVLVAGIVLWLSGRSAEPGRTPVAFGDRDWLLIAEFENRTGEPLFDDTLEAALRRELVNSGAVKVAPPGRVQDALRLMGKPADTRVDAVVAREAALRDGAIRAVLAGRIERLGSTYLLSVDLIEPAEGATLASLSDEAESEDEILEALERLSRRTREALGDTLPDIDPSGADLRRVTTPSLRALQLYTEADRLITHWRHEPAEKLLRQAIAEDPLFASAYTHLAWSIYNQGPWRSPGDYLPWAEKAVELASGATVVERHFIDGSRLHLVAVATQQDAPAEEALTHFLALLRLDPGNFWAAENAASLLTKLGRATEIPELMRTLLVARPNDVGTLTRMARGLVEVRGDLEAAQPFIERAKTLQASVPTRDAEAQRLLELFHLHELWVEGDIEGVAGELQRLWSSIPDRPLAERVATVRQIANFYLDLGMFGRAEEIQASFGAFHPIEWEFRMAWRRLDRERLREIILGPPERAHPLPWSRNAFGLVQLGLFEDAKGELARIPPGVELEAGPLVLATEGAIDLAEGRPAEAIPKLESALLRLGADRGLGFHFAAARLLADALVQTGESSEALAVLEAASRFKPRLLEMHRNYWLDLRLDLASHYRALGREADALEIEDEVRRYCAYADEEFPVRRELARRPVPQTDRT